MKIQSYLNGVLTGLCIGIFFAPESGRDSRRKLSVWFNSLRSSVNDAYIDSKETLSDKLTEITNKQKAEVKEDVLEIKDDIKASRH